MHYKERDDEAVRLAKAFEAASYTAEMTVNA